MNDNRIFCELCAQAVDMKLHWISVKDRLPAENMAVLVYQYENEIENGIYVAWIDKFGKENKPIWQYSLCCGCFVPQEVTHWMPLPEPPK